MKLSHLTLAALLLAALPCVSLLYAAEDATADETQAATDPLDQLKADPNNVEALNAYLQKNLGAIMRKAGEDADGAIKQLGEMKKTLSQLKPTDEKAVNFFAQVDNILDTFTDRIELQAMSLADLREKIAAAPEDAELVGKYGMKVMMELAGTLGDDWKTADKRLTEETAYLDSLAEKTEVPAVKTAVTSAKLTLSRLTAAIERQKRLEELVGKPAMPLSAEAWVNGAPLTDAELKGKVVMLDFFAIWCGPCIATFPHLRELEKEYGDKGLEIIGVTGYYNYGWNEERMAPAPSQDAEVSHEDEQVMLQKFAASHELKHVFAIDPEGKMSKYYGVSGIPHIVLIDKEGKIALVKVGSGEANAKAIEAKVKELLGES
ncbi:redoxin family protein [Blastopirellula marina]|uniref:Probable thioredoxin n=1 Tax=Blastopirellula marina DSM 3645 TaxID=314230 RepID=A4A1T4_9BACT|nr:redoxin family protein [Blastopirellula marina]EAQ77300.1 probable thioredoxin [Blastopirellula marina DSM 3645]